MITKHVGRLNNTGTRIVVVFRKLPDDLENCLVVESDRLPDRMHDNMMEIIGSKEAQSTFDLYEVLGRRTFTEGGNVLQTLHRQGLLRKVAIKDVTLYPMPNNALPLELANQEIDKQRKQSVENGLKVLESVSAPAVVTPEVSNEQMGIAKNLIAQADMLEEDAKKKREEAYMLAPELKPKKGRPEGSTKKKD